MSKIYLLVSRRLKSGRKICLWIPIRFKGARMENKLKKTYNLKGKTCEK